MYGSPLKAFAALRVTSDKVFITNGDDFYSPTEGGGSGARSAERGGSDAFPCFLSRYGRGKLRGPQIFPSTTDASSLPPSWHPRIFK